jgi:hypothetical protein
MVRLRRLKRIELQSERKMQDGGWARIRYLKPPTEPDRQPKQQKNTCPSSLDNAWLFLITLKGHPKVVEIQVRNH